MLSYQYLLILIRIVYYNSRMFYETNPMWKMPADEDRDAVDGGYDGLVQGEDFVHVPCDNVAYDEVHRHSVGVIICARKAPAQRKIEHVEVIEKHMKSKQTLAVLGLLSSFSLHAGEGEAGSTSTLLVDVDAVVARGTVTPVDGVTSSGQADQLCRAWTNARDIGSAARFNRSDRAQPLARHPQVALPPV